MRTTKESAVESGQQSRFDNYQPSFDTALVQSSGWGLSFLSSICRHLVQVSLIGILAFGSYWVISHYVFQMVEVAGSSMSPTLRNSEHYVLNRWAFLVRDPRPNDIVVLLDPADNLYSVKRVIAHAGDSVQVKAGEVFVNGRKLNEPYLPPGTMTFVNRAESGDQAFVCEAGQYFVMGDNRSNSEDSRSYGTITREQIVGTLVR